MAIQVRRGLEKDFDPNKMLPGEWAVAIEEETSKQIVWMCFAPGVVKRMGTYDDFKEQIAEITADIKDEYLSEFQGILDQIEELAKETTENTATVIQIKSDITDTYLPKIFEYMNAAASSASQATASAETATNKASESADSASQSANSAIQSQSYAVGGTGTRDGEDSDNSKYYYELAKLLCEALEESGFVYSVNGKAGVVSLTASDVGAVSTKGGAMTGLLNLYQQLRIIDDAGVYKTVMQLFNPTPDSPTSNGSEIVFGAGGNVFIGAGESHINLRNALASEDTILDGEVYTNSGERAYGSADADYLIYSNCNSIADRKAVCFDKSGNFYPPITGQSINLGKSTNPFDVGYINEVIGSLTGGINVQSVTTSGTDLNDYTTPGIYYFSSTYTPTNIPIGVNGFLIVFKSSTNVKQIWTRQGTRDSNDHQTYMRMGQLSSDTWSWGTWRRFLMDADSSSFRPVSKYMSGTTTSINDLLTDGSWRIYISNGSDDANYLGWYGHATVENIVCGNYIFQRITKVGTGKEYWRYNVSEIALSYDLELFSPTNELFGKTAIFFGDSITWGELADGKAVRVSRPYPTVFGNITGCNVINAGVRGATASSAYPTGSFAAQITAQAENILKATHAFICFGVNDFSKAVPVGNASTSESFYADYLAGIKGILVTNPNIEIIVILPPRGKGYTNNANWRNGNGDVFDSYINAMIEIATLTNLRVVDLGKVGMNAYNIDTFYPDDNNHLTQEGYTLLGEHLAKTYKTGTYESKREFYDRGYRVATNQLGTMPFPNPNDIQGNSYYDGIYWSILGTDTAGITSYKNVQIVKGENYHFEFFTCHRDKANSRTATYTITMANVSDSSIQYVFKKTLTCVYERLCFDFYANNASGFYTINIVVEGDSVYIASPSLSYGGIIPESRKRKIGKATMSSTNTMTVNRNKFINGEFIFNVKVTADVSTTNLLRVDLNTSNSGDTSPYLPTGSHYFTGVDVTDKKAVPMYWKHDDSNAGQYLLRVLSGIESGHIYVANGILYMGANNAVHEVIAQEY